MCDVKDAVVLVIDDNPDNLFLMKLILIQSGYKVETACCGKEGLEKIHKLVPDLIILDMMMPDLTGFEVIEQIKPHHHLSKIPIVICTANRFVQKNNIKDVSDVCYKPIDIEDILATVNSLIACCGSGKSLTLVIDIDDNDPLHLQHQQLTSSYCDRVSILETLQNQRYKIVNTVEN